MNRFIPTLIVLALLLAACGGQATPSNQPAAGSPATEAPAAQPATTEPAATEPAASTTEAAPAGGSGTAVYTLVPEESQVTYEVGEVFINQNNRFNVAKGVTKGIRGEVTIDLTAPQNSNLAPVVIDISQFTSDSARRDAAIRDRFLESARFPQATFKPATIEGLPATLQEGVDIPLKISGDLTIREVTKPVTFDAVIRLQAGMLTGQANTQILMSDFGFGPINIGGILKTEDQVKVTLDFVARPKS